MKHLLLFGFLILAIVYSCNNSSQEDTSNSQIIKEYYAIEGQTQGTLYHIKYEGREDLTKDVDSILNDFENSMSTYRENSTISKIGKNDNSVVLDKYFLQCFKKGTEISNISHGAFDMSVAPLVNIWGFGFEHNQEADKDAIDSILQFVGYEKIRLENNRIVKDDSRIMLDASAIAKGQSVDVVSEYLESLGIVNYLVEIGGELRAKGTKFNNENWIIGIDKPIDNSGYDYRELQAKLKVINMSVATSGSYRRFYEKDGQRYSHTIDPHTGYPVTHGLLSTTVIAPDCMTADAYATAFMVLGVEESKKIAEKDPVIQAYFIFATETDSINITYTKGFENLFVE